MLEEIIKCGIAVSKSQLVLYRNPSFIRINNNTATTVNASNSNQRQFFESLFKNNTLNSCQMNINFPTGK